MFAPKVTSKSPGRRRQTALRSTIAALSVLYAAQAVSAAEEVDPFALSPEQLFGATVVSVSKMPERLGDAAAAIFVLTNEDIIRSGATSIPEALRLVPGVQVARVNSSGWAISVRGFNSALANKLLVLIDGRAVYDPLFSGVYWDVQDTALEDIERIEVIRGPGASLWGANAVNGVINIITKRASDTQGLLASAIAGDQERAIFTARYGGSAGDNVHWRAYGKYLDHAPQQTLTGVSAQDEWTAWRGGFRVDADTNGGNSFTLQGDIYRSDSGQYRTVPDLNAPYASVVEENITAQGGNLLGRWSRELGNGSRITAQTYLDMTQRTQQVLKDERTTFDLSVEYAFPSLDRHSLMAGLGYRYTADDLTATPLATFVQPNQRLNLFSGFLQDEITLSPERWFLTLGSKVEHNDYTGFEIQPNARIHWRVDEIQTAWASVSRAVRTPSEVESNLNLLAGVFPPGAIPLPISVELRASPDFESESLIAYEMGYRRQWTPSVQMDVAVFYNDYDKLATLSLLPPEFAAAPPHFILPVGTTNLTTGKTYGFETVFDWRADERLSFSAGYSLLVMELDGPPADVAIASEAAENQSPRNQFNVRSQWNVTDRVAFDTTLYYVDSLPIFSVDPYWRLDGRLGWRITDTLQLDIVGQNLLDDSHREFGAATDANAISIGRSIFGRLTCRN